MPMSDMRYSKALELNIVNVSSEESSVESATFIRTDSPRNLLLRIMVCRNIWVSWSSRIEHHHERRFRQVMGLIIPEMRGSVSGAHNKGSGRNFKKWKTGWSQK